MVPIAIGVGLGLVLAGWLRTRPAGEERRGYSFALVVAAAVYVGLALSSLDPGWLTVEVGGALFFGLLARLGRVGSAWWLTIGWVIHVLWDLGLHGGGDPAFVPAWYPLLCAGFDPVVAAAIAWRMRGWVAVPAASGFGAGPTTGED